MQISRRAFSLVELLVVITIISVLIAMLLPSLKGARQSALSLRCMAYQRPLAVALTCYAMDTKGNLPWVDNVTNGNHPSFGPFGYVFSPFLNPAANPELQGVGALYKSSYLTDWRTFYCPGRGSVQDSYSISYGLQGYDGWHGNYVGKWPLFPNTTSIGSGWIRAGYITATCNRWISNGVLTLEQSKVANINRAHPQKIIAFEPCYLDNSSATTPVGFKYQEHNSYNMVTFDGAGKTISDPNDWIQKNSYFQIPNCMPPGASGYWWMNTGNDQIIRYLQVNAYGWSEQQYEASIVRTW